MVLSLSTFEDSLPTVGESLLLDERWEVCRGGAAVDYFGVGEKEGG